MTEKSQEIVVAIIDELYGRGGFDDWWGNLDPDIKLDVWSALRHEVEKVLQTDSTGTPNA